MMRIRRIRLINFHNFVDETISVERGGHLFLLGDNGSGKTTVLDAVHLVLSGDDLELNAAARVGGRRDEGRSLQGIVLRHDFERGVRCEGGAIAYAAVELHDPERDGVLTLGVGIEATTLEARVTKWGIVAPRPLDEVPLIVDRDGQPFAATREGLRAAMGPGEVFYRIGDYRAAVAARLFGGGDRHIDCRRFWSMAKAYREIVAGARDFGALFRRLLPAPDPKVFGEIVQSLRGIADMQTALDELDEQRAYVAGVISLVDEVDEQRTAASRYRWLASHRRRAAIEAELAHSVERVAHLDAEIARLAREVQAAEARIDAADTALRAAEAEDTDGLSTKLRDATSRQRELGGDVAALEREEAEAHAVAEVATRAASEARTALTAAIDRLRAELAAAIEAAAELPGARPQVRALAAAMREGGPGTWSEVRDRASAELRAVCAGARQTRAAANGELERARLVHEQRAEELAALEARAEEQPRVPGFAAARDALSAAGVKATPCYELCEPAESAAPERLAWVESLAGDAALAALVVALGDRDRAVELVAGAAPGVRVVVRTAGDARLPGWADELFGAPTEDDARDALLTLAAAVEQSSRFGPVAPADTRGVLEHRGLAFAPDAQVPRLLGRAARERAHAMRVAAAREAVEVAAQAAATCEARCDIANRRVQLAEHVAAAVEATGSADLTRTDSVASAAADSAKLHVGHASEARARADVARVRLADCCASVNALRARADAIGLDELQARIAELGDVARSARETQRERQGTYGVRTDERAREMRRQETLEVERGGCDQKLAQQSDQLRARIPQLADASDADVERYVRTTQGGDRFKSLEAIEVRVSDCVRREAAAADELERDGSRGVRHIQYAARFGFGYDRALNAVRDRRDQPIAGVLAELERTIDEQRSVITADSRELMETLVMGSLARDLQMQVGRLDTMIADVNRMLRGLRFGRSEYQFRAKPRADRRELVDVVRRISVLDADSRTAFRTWIEDRLDELRAGDGDDVPDILDYRAWCDFSLSMKSEGTDGVDLTRSVRALGSGGEQGVPNYLLVLALGAVLFDSSGAKLRPLLFDEAFYGIDAGRRDQLLRFGSELGLQLLVASPDQDGVTPAVRAATTLFIVKDGNGDVHLAPYHYWHDTAPAQAGLFDAPAPQEPPASAAECRMTE